MPRKKPCPRFIPRDMPKDEPLKAKRCALLVEVGEALHQVVLTEREEKQLLNLVSAMHGGAIVSRDTPVETITLKHN